MATNHLNLFKRSNDPWNLPNFHMTVVLVHVKCTKKFKGRKRKLSPVRHQTCIVPSRNHEPSSELLRFVRGACPNVRQTSQFLYHIILVAWHYINQGFICFCFFGIKMPCHSMHTYSCICVHVVIQICLKIPSNLLHMELTRTQVHKNMIFQTVMVRRCM